MVVESWTNFTRIHGGEPGARDVFEKAMGELLKAENPEKDVHVIEPSQGDGGIDICVYQKEGIDIYQCKFFMDKMNSDRWQKINNSFARAMKYYKGKVLHWYLCVPLCFRKEDIQRIKQFKKERSSSNVEILFIDGNEIINRMQKFGKLLTDKYFAPEGFTKVNKDEDALEFYVKCFNRGAFKNSIENEVIKDFGLALSTVQTAIRTGILVYKVGNKEIEENGCPYTKLNNKEWCNKMATIDQMIEDLRYNLEKESEMHIFYFNNGKDLKFESPNIYNWFNEKRDEILNILNSMCDEAGIQGIHLTRRSRERMH